MDNLRIAIVQFSMTWQNAAANRMKLDTLLTEISQDVELIILPEMFATGFSMNTSQIAETMDGPTIQWMKKTAVNKTAAVVGSLAIVYENKYYNRLLFVKPDGSIAYYDKKHLFTLANEHEYYQPGEEQLVIDYKGIRIAPLICYDIRFPSWCRMGPQADVLIFVACFPQKRIKAWTKLLAARAIENQMFVVGVNRVGEDGNGIQYNGESAVVDYEGVHIVETFEDEAIVEVNLNLKEQNEFRKNLPFLKDGN